MKPRVYMHAKQDCPISALLAQHSFQRHPRDADAFEIRILYARARSAGPTYHRAGLAHQEGGRGTALECGLD